MVPGPSHPVMGASLIVDNPKVEAKMALNENLLTTKEKGKGKGSGVGPSKGVIKK